MILLMFGQCCRAARYFRLRLTDPDGRPRSRWLPPGAQISPEFYSDFYNPNKRFGIPVTLTEALTYRFWEMPEIPSKPGPPVMKVISALFIGAEPGGQLRHFLHRRVPQVYPPGVYLGKKIPNEVTKHLRNVFSKLTIPSSDGFILEISSINLCVFIT